MLFVRGVLSFFHRFPVVINFGPGPVFSQEPSSVFEAIKAVAYSAERIPQAFWRSHLRTFFMLNLTQGTTLNSPPGNLIPCAFWMKG